MSKCPNCGATLSCGCQKRQLPNGKMGCSKCVSAAVNSKKSADPVDPIINQVTIEPKLDE
jgi:protein-arginine kinase activator protein McsA